MTRIPIDDDNTQGPFGPDAMEHPGAEPPDAEIPDPATEPARPRAAGGTSAEGGTLERLQTERDDLYTRLARATAEFKNSQRRTQTEMEQRLEYANSSLIKSLIPVIDNFERALAVDPTKADVRSILKGMQIVHDQWLNVLKQQEVEEIAPAAGTPFDPSKHEALMQQDAVYPVPTVVQLLQKGYALHGRTLRPAQVAVSKSS